MTPKTSRPGAPKPPLAYGKMLERKRIELGRADRKAFAVETGVDYATVFRNETGDAARSVKGSSAVRAALISLGASVPPVPTDENWTEGDEPHTPLPPAAEKVRRNLLRFREHLKLDQSAVAYMAGLGTDEYRLREIGAVERVEDQRQRQCRRGRHDDARDDRGENGLRPRCLLQTSRGAAPPVRGTRGVRPALRRPRNGRHDAGGTRRSEGVNEPDPRALVGRTWPWPFEAKTQVVASIAGVASPDHRMISRSDRLHKLI